MRLQAVAGAARRVTLFSSPKRDRLTARITSHVMFSTGRCSLCEYEVVMMVEVVVMVMMVAMVMVMVMVIVETDL